MFSPGATLAWLSMEHSEGTGTIPEVGRATASPERPRVGSVTTNAICRHLRCLIWNKYQGLDVFAEGVGGRGLDPFDC